MSRYAENFVLMMLQLAPVSNSATADSLVAAIQQRLRETMAPLGTTTASATLVTHAAKDASHVVSSAATKDSVDRLSRRPTTVKIVAGSKQAGGKTATHNGSIFVWVVEYYYNEFVFFCHLVKCCVHVYLSDSHTRILWGSMHN